MASLRQLVGSPAVNSIIGYLSRPRTDPDVARVALVEDFAHLERVDPQAIVLLTDAAARSVSSYRFDVALRIARSRDVAAIVLPADHADSVTPTAAAIAARSGIAILAAAGAPDIAQLAIAIAREIAGAADVALLRAHTAVRAIEAHPGDAPPDSLVVRAGAALGVALRVVPSEPEAGPCAPIVVDGNVEGWTTAAPQQGDLGLALDIVLHAAANGAARALAAARRAQELPIQTREQALTELLASPRQGRPPLVQRARTLGVEIDGWTVAVRMEFESLTGGTTDDDLQLLERRVRLARSALQAVQADGGGSWHSARAGLALVLLRMYADDPGLGAAGAVAREVQPVLDEVRSQLGAALVRCGVGSAHHGPDGLFAAVAEAKAAVALARTSGRVNTAVPFDSVGLRRTLVEWYASDTAREAVTSVLAPLTSLSGTRGERLIQTLHVYLDQQGSLTRTAERLSMHRNAVSYRINQIFGLLDVDPDNPDDLLLLQLACRARELT